MIEIIKIFWKTIKKNKGISILVAIILIALPKSVGLWQDIDFVKNKLQNPYDMKINVVQRIENIHVNTATSRKVPYISSIGSWYKIRLTNIGQNEYAIVNVLYDNKQEISVFKKYYSKNNVIYVANKLALPTQIKSNESIDIYIFIPFKLNRGIGAKLFSFLYTKDEKLDSPIELYLFGNSPRTQKGRVPIYDKDENFIRVMEVDIEVLNWDEYLAPRELFKNMDFEKNIMPFDYNMHDGFKYMNNNLLLAEIALGRDYNAECNKFRKNNYISLSFVTNTDQNFTQKLYVDSTCLQLDQVKK